MNYLVQLKNIIAVFETGHALVQVPIKNINDPCAMEAYLKPHKTLLKCSPELMDVFENSEDFLQLTETETELYVYIQKNKIVDGLKRPGEVVLDLGPRSLYADISNHFNCDTQHKPVQIKVLDCKAALEFVSFEEISLF
ncbi:hypothetical protein HDV04_002912 [Boothiomyces sp. JEL0838]|nr:hypothetical protein HDV04_002912 [Boothiomyces sp. JEL0838]